MKCPPAQASGAILIEKLTKSVSVTTFVTLVWYLLTLRCSSLNGCWSSTQYKTHKSLACKFWFSRQQCCKNVQLSCLCLEIWDKITWLVEGLWEKCPPREHLLLPEGCLDLWSTAALRQQEVLEGGHFSRPVLTKFRVGSEIFQENGLHTIIIGRLEVPNPDFQPILM